jgi:hypothetical protein
MIPPMPIASVVEEQTAKNTEISHNVFEVVRCTTEITENISGVTQTVNDTSNVIG